MGSQRVGHDLETAAAAKSLQSCPTLCDPIDGSPPGSSVPGILQARILEWVALLPDSGIKLWFPALEKEMATHSNVLDWRIPGREEPGGLLSMGSHRVGHD